jgi:small subunit ribosomal protein S2
VFILDTKKEHLAVAEANKLGIPVVAVVDTNCDPDLVQYVIPGNDDAIRASHLLCRVISDAVIEGRYIASKRNPAVAAPAAAVRSPEEEAAFQTDQATARREAMAAQADREARLSAQRTAEVTEADDESAAPAETQEEAAAPAEAAEVVEVVEVVEETPDGSIEVVEVAEIVEVAEAEETAPEPADDVAPITDEPPTDAPGETES